MMRPCVGLAVAAALVLSIPGAAAGADEPARPPAPAAPRPVSPGPRDPGSSSVTFWSDSTALALGRASLSVLGDTASGFGDLARGIGLYNWQTAAARAIHAEINLRTNEYLWRSRIVTRLRYRMQQIARRQRINAAHDARQWRLRYAPEPRDIYTGDAINILLADLVRPTLAVRPIRDRPAPIPSASVKQIPLRYAAGGVTVTLKDLARKGAPKAFRDGVIAPGSGMFEAYLGRLDASPETSLADLVAFMKTFQLRFGVAETPLQRNLYDDLYVRLAALRGETERPVAASRGGSKRR